MKRLSEESLEKGFKKIEDFDSVHHSEDQTELIEALFLLQESLGIDDEVRNSLYARVGDFPLVQNPNGAGHFLLGLMVGLSIAEYESERKE